MIEAPPSRYRWIWYGGGLAMIAWGIRGLLQHTSTRGLTHAMRFAVIGLAGHDAVFAPAAFVLGYAAARLVPLRVRPPVQVGLAMSGVLVLLALPMIRSDHRQRTSSILPLPYERNLAILLALVLLGVVASIVVRVGQDRRLTRAAATGQSSQARLPG